MSTAATVPTGKEKARACASPLALKAENTREYWIQILDLVKSYLRTADDFMRAREILKKAKENDCYKLLGYESYQEMLEAEGISLMLKTARVIIECKANPGITMEELARKVRCSVSLAARAVSEAGLKEPTFKEIIQRDHIRPDGTLHIDGQPASQRAVAKKVGCDESVVRWAREKSTSGKIPHRPISSDLEKAQSAFRRLVKEDRDAFDLWRAEQPL